MKTILKLLLGATVIFPVGCAAVDPVNVQYTTSCGWTQGSTANQTENAPKCAAELRDRYMLAVSDRAKVEMVTNVGLIGLVSVVTGLAAFDKISTQAVAAAGLGGGLLYVAPRLLGSEARDFIHLAGAEAMTCTLDATAPARRLLESGSFFTELDADQALLRQYLYALGAAALGGGAEKAAAEAVLNDGETVLKQSENLEQKLKTTNDRLLNAVRSIDIDVTAAVRRDRVDPRELIAALQGSVGIVGESSGAIRSALGLGASAGDVTGVRNAAPELAKAIEAAQVVMRRLAEKNEAMKAALVPFEVSTSLRERCSINNVDVQPFALDESRIALSVPATGKMTAAIVTARGGKAPHSAEFVGKVPADPDALTRSIEETRDGYARIRVTATSAVPAERFTLVVRDATSRDARATISFAGAKASNANRGTDSSGGGGGNKIAEVEALQKELKALATCTAKDGAAGFRALQKSFDPGTIDGFAGTNTINAANTLLGVLNPPKRWDGMGADDKARATAALPEARAVKAANCAS